MKLTSYLFSSIIILGGKMKKVITVIVLILCMFISINKVDATTLQDLYDELAVLEKSYKDSQEQKKLTESEMNRVKASIANTEYEIKKAQEDIVKAQEDIEQSEDDIEAKKEETNQLLLYLQVMNSTGNSMLDYVMDADDYTDFIYRYSVITQMSDYNNDVIEELNTLISTLNSKKQQLNSKQRELSKKKNQLQSDYAIMYTQYKEEHADGLDLKDQIDEQKATIRRYEKLGCKRKDNINSCNGAQAVDGWVYPMDRFYQSSSYAEVRGNVRHYAVDLAASEGSIIRAAGNGEVLSAGLTSTVSSCYSPYTKKNYTNCHCGGYVIKILHNYKGTTYLSLYMHMLTSNVKAGDKVTGGQIIGTSGGGKISVEKYHDHCTRGAHLHFAMAYGNYIGYSSQKGNTFNPIMFFPAMKGEGTYYNW